MNATPTLTAGPTRTAYRVRLASTPDDVRSAQRLRYLVFADELGARLPAGRPGLDVDEFDEHCDHLLVYSAATGATVGTYRLLRPGRAPNGRRYADAEFDLTALAPLRDELFEAGRSCVHPDHRDGAVINLMWTGIARYLHLHGGRWLAGCASVPLADGGVRAAATWQLARTTHLAPPRLRVAPHRPYEVPAVSTTDRRALLAAVPPLLRGYLRLGAWVGGPPALDPDFGVADYFVLLSLDRMNPRYLAHFLGPVEAT
jgi:putative hemolysin